ncbi:MAG: type IX secretion system protein PorQ [Cyclobacteriaceae bacterium]
MKLDCIFFYNKRNVKHALSIMACVLLMLEVEAQSNSKSFTSLEMPSNAVLSGLGSVNVSKADYSIDFFQYNPALASDTLNGWASANHLFYFAGTGLSSFSYQHGFKSVGPLSFAVNHLNLGSIEGYDIIGTPTGSFNSGETTLVIGKSHQVNLFRFGVNVKGVFSTLAGYRANALLIDLGGVFVHPTKDLRVGLVIKNAGIVLSEYSPTSKSKLPFDVQMGITYKPEHMPLRFSVTAYRLTDYKVPYEGDTLGEEMNTLDKVISHLTFGGELLIHRNVNILFGYNFLKHKELKLETAGGGSGVSLGAIARLKQMSLAFSRTGYVTGGAYQLSLGVNTNKIFK